MLDKKLTEFKNEVLVPILLDSYLDKAFPEMEFCQRGTKWTSRFHIDGKASHSIDQSYIYKNGSTLCDQNGAKIGIVDFAAEKYNTDFVGAMKFLAKICNLELPKQDGTSKDFESFRKQQENLETSKNRQTATLFSPSGAEALRYLKEERGYTEDVIRAMGLGYLSSDEAAQLQKMGEGLPNNIQDFPLSIPYVSKGRLRGFKFRYISAEAREKYGKGKYRNTQSLSGKMNAFPFGYEPQQIKDEVIVVEGELDALHIKAKGITNVIATSGGSLKEETLSLLTENSKLKKVTFIADNDESGQGFKFVEAAVKLVEEFGLTSFVVELPEGSKDVDEYLCKNSIENLASLIYNAREGYYWIYDKIVEEEQRKYPNGYQNDRQGYEIQDKVFTLTNSIKNDATKKVILSSFAEAYQIADIDKAIVNWANKIQEAEETRKIESKTKDAIEAARQLAEDGKGDEARSVLEEALADAKKMDSKKKFRDLLHVTTRAERLQKFKNKPTALETSYCFTERGERLPLTIPSGALTIIAAPTSHGKSTLLRNLALDIAKRYTEKSVLYFTFEESEEDVVAQFTNTYIGKRLHAESYKHSQLESLVDYFKTGEIKNIGDKDAEITREDFLRKEMEFSTQYLDSGKIRPFYKDYDLETFVDALEYAVENIPTRAIFIDYIQILRSTKFAKQPRAEQLKEICISLKDFSVKHSLPIIIAAQLVRDANTPLSMDNTQMSESSDIEKAANTILCVWNSSFKGDRKLTKKEEEELLPLQNKGFTLGEHGKLFIKLTKRRGSRGVGMYSILEYKGCSGKVVENYIPEVEQSLPLQEEEDYRGF